MQMNSNKEHIVKPLETILQFRIADEYYGIDSDISNHILRVPLITSVPLTHQYFRGIVVLTGRIVPVLDLRTILSDGMVDTSQESSRIITLQINDEEVAILVDEVIDTVNIEQENYEENISDENAIVGFYKNNDSLIQILQVEQLIQNETIQYFEPLEVEQLTEETDTAIQNDDETKRYLLFSAKEEYFAIDIELVAELIFVPKNITPIAGSDAVSLGAITLREEVIDVVDFNLLFGFEAVNRNDHRSRLLILKEMDKKLALCVESVEEIKDVPLSDIEAIHPDALEHKIEALYKEKEHIVSIISNIYAREIIDHFCVSITKASDDEEKQQEANMRELTVFAIGKEEFAFNIENVQEIITYQEVTPLPQSDEYVEGVINLRGTIIPVINLPKKIGFDPKITEKSKIIVCNIEDEKVGFLVDDVNDIMFIEDKYVSIAKNQDGIVGATISLDEGKRVILELRIENIISIDELESMKET